MLGDKRKGQQGFYQTECCKFQTALFLLLSFLQEYKRFNIQIYTGVSYKLTELLSWRTNHTVTINTKKKDELLKKKEIKSFTVISECTFTIEKWKRNECVTECSQTRNVTSSSFGPKYLKWCQNAKLLASKLHLNVTLWSVALAATNWNTGFKVRFLGFVAIHGTLDTCSKHREKQHRQTNVCVCVCPLDLKY